jgi:hypothetical protein
MIIEHRVVLGGDRGVQPRMPSMVDAAVAVSTSRAGPCQRHLFSTSNTHPQRYPADARPYGLPRQ